MFKLALIVCFAMAMTAIASPSPAKEAEVILARIARSPPPLFDNHGAANAGNNDGSGNLATGGSGNTYNNFQNSDLHGKGVHLTPSHR